eukprot:9483165-Pyramimonas_sp.AAC.1
MRLKHKQKLDVALSGPRGEFREAAPRGDLLSVSPCPQEFKGVKYFLTEKEARAWLTVVDNRRTVSGFCGF